MSLSNSHKLIVFDNDGTLNTQFSCWRYIQQPLGIFEPEGKELLKQHLRSEMDYEQFCIRAVSRWKGLKHDDLLNIITEIPLRDGTIETLNYFREHGYKISCVSSGFDLWKSVFEVRHGFVFDDFISNHLVTDHNGELTGEIRVFVTDDTPLKNKGEHLKKLCAKYQVEPAATIMVGDGRGDIHAFAESDISFAVSPTHDEVADAADHVIEGSSIIGILNYFKSGKYFNNHTQKETPK